MKIIHIKMKEEFVLRTVNKILSIFDTVKVISVFRDFFCNRHNIGNYCNNLEKISEYDQGIPQSHTADQPMAP